MRKRKLDSSRGSVGSTVALSLPVLMGVVAMGVDWGQVSVARLAVRAAADEVALAAASALSDRPETTAEITAAYAVGNARASQYVSMMELNGLTLELEGVTFGYYTAEAGWSTTIPTGKSPNAVQATVSTTIDMSFARLFGLDQVTVSRSSKAGATIVPGRAPDLVIVQDVTPSMSSTDIANSKAANKALVDCIEDNAHPSTRGAFVKFASHDKTLMSLQSYTEAPGDLYDVATAASPTTTYSNSGICTSGGCTSHSAGLYAAVDILNSASEPPEDVGQAIIIITDGAPAVADTGCSGVASSSSSATAYQKWLANNAGGRCGQLSAQTTSTNCNNLGGRWTSTSSGYTCRPSDNGAESFGLPGPGACSKTGYSNEFTCEGAGGTWKRSSTSSTANPSSLTRWTDSARTLAVTGTWGEIDVYAVYYSDGASDTYKANALAYLENHVVSGKGAELGVLDAPTGTELTEALKDLCEEYTVGTPGLIE